MPTFNVPDMSCGHCVKAITEAVHGLDADAKVETDLETKNVSIESQASAAVLVEALTQAGYPPT
jgi:copper chaperone